jgi:hypothetical protein
MVMETSPLSDLGNVESGGEFNLSRGSTIEDSHRFNGFLRVRKMPKIEALQHRLFPEQCHAG